jgi:hypothetical protein
MIALFKSETESPVFQHLSVTLTTVKLRARWFIIFTGFTFTSNDITFKSPFYMVTTLINNFGVHFTDKIW